MGLAWKVRDGSKISIWQDKWVRMGTGFIYTSVRILPHDAKVSALLDKDTNWWDTELVQQIFVAEEAESICGMAVSPRSGKTDGFGQGLTMVSFRCEVLITWQRTYLKLIMEVAPIEKRRGNSRKNYGRVEFLKL
jgi:hypothetical protein